MTAEGEVCKQCTNQPFEMCECCGQWDTVKPMYTKSAPRWVEYTHQACTDCLEVHPLNEQLRCYSCSKNAPIIKTFRLCKDCYADHVPLCKECNQTSDVWLGDRCINCSIGSSFIPNNSLRVRSCIKCGSVKTLNAENVCENCYIIEAAHTLRLDISTCPGCLTRLTYTDQHYCTTCIERSKQCSACGDLFVPELTETLCSKHIKRCSRCTKSYRSTDNSHICENCEISIHNGACYLCGNTESLKDITGKCKDGCNHAVWDQCQSCGDIIEFPKKQCDNCLDRKIII